VRILLLVATLALVLGGCVSQPLEDAWSPLVRVEEDPTRIMSADVVTTVVDTVFVHDLAAFERNFPEGSVARAALLTHEREHARRQLATGAVWFARYLGEPSFRWNEEQIGWRLEIEAHLAAGERVVPEEVADFLSTNYMGMVDRETALAWVRSVVAGR
jgi:hypothetical protein